MDNSRNLAQMILPSPKKRRIFDVPSFIDVVRETWDIAHPKSCQFVHAYPIQDGENLVNLHPPVIDYLIADKTPTQMGSVQEIKPRIRTVYKETDNAQEAHTVFGQWFTYIVDFGIWESDWKKVEKLQSKFEDFMLVFTGTFKELGVAEMLYLKGTEDIPRNSIWRTDLVSSHVYYKLVIEHTLDYPNQVIESITSKLVKLGGEEINGPI